MNGEKLKFWKGRWGDTYDRNFKGMVLGNLLEQMSINGKIGEVVLDVGSGKEPVSRLIPEPKKVITVDLGGPLALSKSHLHLQCDLDELFQGIEPVAAETTEEIAKFLGSLPQEINQSPWADTIIMADILNYVSSGKVLETCAKSLRPGGRAVIFNKPNRGYRLCLSDKGLKGNSELFETLEQLNLKIEYRDFPWELPKEEQFRDQALVVLVARKMLSESSGD